MRMAKVSLDGFTTADVPCYTDGRLWNGFATPLFDAAGVGILKEMLGAADGPGAPPSLLIEGDLVSVYDSEEGEYFEAHRSVITVDGQEVPVWSVGENWTWNPCELDDEDPAEAALEEQSTFR